MEQSYELSQSFPGETLSPAEHNLLKITQPLHTATSQGTHVQINETIWDIYHSNYQRNVLVASQMKEECKNKTLFVFI